MKGYNIFVLIELAKSLGMFSNEIEYDVIWEQGSKLYDEFKLSSFDNGSKSEYDCINDFLNCKMSINGTDWHSKFCNWRIKKGFTRKEQYLPIINIYRRLNMFKNCNVNANLIISAFPSEVKHVKGLLVPSDVETPRIINWYNLSKLGKELMQELMSELTWNKKEMNSCIFNMT